MSQILELMTEEDTEGIAVAGGILEGRKKRMLVVA